MELLKKVLKCLVIGTLAGLSIALFTNFFFKDLINRLEYVTYYMRSRWEYSEMSKEDLSKLHEQNYGINIIDIDDRSMKKMGLYWNWDRSYHADMINTLSAHFPAAVVFDIFFSTPEDHNERAKLEGLLLRSKEMNPDIGLSDRMRQSIISTIDYDQRFIDATRDAGCVFHGVCLADERDYRDYALSQIKHRMTMAWHDSLNPQSTVSFSPDKRKKIIDRKSIIDGIFPDLARASRGIGHIDIIPNDDGVIREIPLIYGFGDNDPVYLPISIRTAASLFATPNDEIIYEPGKFIDIGKPFKVFCDSSGEFSFSYPNVTESQVRAILKRSKEIISHSNKSPLEISTFMAASRDIDGCLSLEMSIPGVIPCELTTVLLASDLEKAINIEQGQEYELGSQIVLRRDSDVDWVISAPFDVQEWWFTKADLITISECLKKDLDKIRAGERKLIFHNFTVKNIDKVLVSSIPCLKDLTLKELCTTGWKSIEAMRPGTRMDFGAAVRIPLSPLDRHIITFFGPGGKPFPRYSYYDILNNRVQGSLEGKIFIVGSTAPGLFDIKAVPHERSYPAVEIHASMLNSFLTNTFVKRLSGWQDFAILLMVGIILGFLSFMFKPVVGGILTVISIFLYFLLAMDLFSTEHLWIEIARPILTIVLTYTAVMVYRYITEEKGRKFLQSTFKQYLSPELIDMMYKRKQMPMLGGDEGIRTAYFTDIQGFSTFSEKLGSPTRLVELLNEYLSVMTDTLLKHYGTLDKYEGDAIIAFFGAPMPMQDHAYQACLTALDMQESLSGLRKKWISEGDKWPSIVHDIRMRIGINSGLITTGNMGSNIRKNYTMMGDAVNLAARLESAAKQYGVYTMMSQFTYDLIKDHFEVRQLDKITVVGKSEPVVVYELVGQKGKISSRVQELLGIYDQGLQLYYSREWDRAIGVLEEANLLEPYKDVAPKGITPSKKIIEYCKVYKADPPDDSWDGISRLTSK
ncbi:MAG: adenylate/guanylate cyclase domain-containing protein [Fibrobacter sp.]|nr:adenylate/guanylate cyclase domain-containing protein [Fibrobacter sp.]